MTIRTRTAGLAAACALLISLVLAGQAHASIYYSQAQGPLILRTNQDGSGQINLLMAPGALISRIAVDASHIYWADRGAGTIGRANLDGSGADPAFITSAGNPVSAGTGSLIEGLAVDADHIYWTVGADSIGRANLDGTGATRTFIPNVTAIEVAVDAGHIYWTSFGVIGRANLDGTAVNPTFVNATPQGFATAPLLGLAVDAGHIYWTNSHPLAKTVGRANIDGTGVNTNLVVPGGTNPNLQAIAVDGGHLYWTDPNHNMIGRANLDGTDAEPTFLSGASQPGGIAVNDTSAPETTISAGPSGLTNDNTPTFGFSSSEAGSTFQCRVDNAAFASCASPSTTAALADGAHTFQVRATDAAANTDPSPASRSFTVDTVAPNTTITSGPAAASTSTTPSFSFTSTESGSTFQCSIDGGAFTSCTSPKTMTLGGGAHAFSVRAIDPAGNVDASPATSSFRICTGLLGGVGVLLNGLLPNSGLLCS